MLAAVWGPMRAKAGLGMHFPFRDRRVGHDLVAASPMGAAKRRRAGRAPFSGRWPGRSCVSKSWKKCRLKDHKTLRALGELCLRMRYSSRKRWHPLLTRRRTR
jgi:hypothetical protein